MKKLFLTTIVLSSLSANVLADYNPEKNFCDEIIKSDSGIYACFNESYMPISKKSRKAYLKKLDKGIKYDVCEDDTFYDKEGRLVCKIYTDLDTLKKFKKVKKK